MSVPISIPFGEMQSHNGIHIAENNAFLALYTTGVKPYLNYAHAPQNTVTNFFFMGFRWDSVPGFPGGGMEAQETPQEAALREIVEEVGTTHLKPANLTPVCSHLVNKGTQDAPLYMATHLCAAEVRFDELRDFAVQWQGAEHAVTEMRGGMLVSTETPDQERGIYAVFQMPLHPTTKEQMFTLMQKFDLAPTHVLDNIQKRFLPHMAGAPHTRQGPLARQFGS